MHFEEGALYHIYNRSNETVFFDRENYLYFLRKVNLLLKPYCEILAWCIMPNHFHFLIQATTQSEKLIEETHRDKTQVLSKNLGIMLSSYTRAINNIYNRKGKLWSHNTEAKKIGGDNLSLSKDYIAMINDNYALACFMYIHQNPVMAGLVENMEDWEFSSYPDFLGVRNGKLVNKDLAFEIIGIDKENFQALSNMMIDDKLLRVIFED